MSLSRAKSRPAAGFTLIELMVALLLGMIVTGAALTVFVTNRQTYRSTESLDRIQENARTAFELMARDLREGAGNTCGKTSKLSMANAVNSPTSQWYTDWSSGVQGYDGNQAALGLTSSGTPTSQLRVTGTDAIDLHSSTSGDVNVIPDPGGNPANIKISNTTGLSDGDIVVACDPGHMAVFQITNVQSSNATVVHNTGTGTPGNCTKGLGSPVPSPCNTNGTSYTFGCWMGQLTGSSCTNGNWPATLAKLQSSRWYVGYNDHGTRSLFHASLVNGGPRTDEIAEGVQDMQLQYLLDGAATYADAASVTAADWQGDKVTAVRITLTMTDSDRTGTDSNVLARNIEHTVTLRNRTQ